LSQDSFDITGNACIHSPIATNIGSLKINLDQPGVLGEERVRTKTQAMSKMVDIAKERVGDKKLHAAIGHTNVPAQAEQLREMLLSQFQCEEIYATELLGVAAVMNGEGLVEFGFYSSD